MEPKGRNDNHAFDYSEITDKIFLGSDFCQAGVCLIHGEEFKKIGVSIEINLSQEANEIPPKDIKGYIWLPVLDGYAPSQNQLAIGTTIIKEAVDTGEKVYIHCKNGHGRAPSMVAAYLIRFKKMTVDQALSLIKEKRPESHIEKTQMEALQEFSQKWK